MAKRDTSFEDLLIRSDPAVKRFHVIKAALVKAGFGSKVHDKKCICLCCVEGGVQAVIKAALALPR